MYSTYHAIPTFLISFQYAREHTIPFPKARRRINGQFSQNVKTVSLFQVQLRHLEFKNLKSE